VENESEQVTRCPRCFGRDVRPSRRGGFLDSLMGKFRRTPYRCRGCHHRFYVYIPREKDEIDEDPDSAETPETGQSDDVAKPAEP
jgi:hypothetical protein